MNAASVKQIKTGLDELTQKELVDACLRLIKFKKENKELLTYILFEEADEAGYISNVKDSVALLFEDVNRTNVYFAKKTLRKIVRTANKFIRYSKEPATEVEILLFVAEKILELGLNMKKNIALENIYLSIIKKINKAIASMHEDLQYDYSRQLKKITDKQYR